MPRAIWKFPFGSEPVQRLEIPARSSLLDVDVKDRRPWAWFACDPKEGKITRTFLLIPTGGPYGSVEDGEEESWSDRLLTTDYYLKTFFSEDRKLVGHLFETGPINPELEQRIKEDLRRAGKVANGGGWG